MLTLFQRTLIVVVAFGFLVVALVVAAKAPAQATTFAPALSLPVNAVVPPGVVTTGDATVKAKPDGAIEVRSATTAGMRRCLMHDDVCRRLRQPDRRCKPCEACTDNVNRSGHQKIAYRKAIHDKRKPPTRTRARGGSQPRVAMPSRMAR